jgi:hypothetical protein
MIAIGIEKNWILCRVCENKDLKKLHRFLAREILRFVIHVAHDLDDILAVFCEFLRIYFDVILMIFCVLNSSDDTVNHRQPKRVI